MKKNPWIDAFKQQIQPGFFLATGLEQIAPRFFRNAIKELRGWTKRQLHIFTERLKMTKALWLEVAKEYKWTCLCCSRQNLYNREIGKIKMEVDHIKPLYLFGLTVRANLQLLCSVCNKRKGVRWIDYRANWVNGRWIRKV